MFHRGFFLGRLVIFLLFIGGIMAVGRGLYRSGYEQGFAQGAVFATTDGEAVPGPAALPWAYGGRHPGGIGLIGGGILGVSLMGFAFFSFAALMIMGALGRRHRWANRHGGHGGWASHGGWGHHRHGGHSRRHPDDIGPEKQPREYM
jgi:hypothetical protein